MKRILVIMFTFLPMLLNAGVIMKHSGERIEDISIKSVTDTEVIYIDLNGVETTILKSDVYAIIYDDGRYEEIQTLTATSMEPAIKSKDTYEVSYSENGQKNVIKYVGSGAKEYNVLAYGVYAGIGYFSNSKYEDVTVEYRVIYKSDSSDPEFKYLGTSPFAYVTEKMYENPITGKGNPYFVNLMKVRPLVIENAKDVKRVEFRLTKEGYKTVIVKPIRDVFIGGGPVMFISLDRLKPLKDGEDDERHVRIADNYDEPAVNESTQNTSEPIYEPQVDPVIVYNEPLYEEPDPVREQPTETVVEVVEEEKEKVPAEQPVVAANESETIFTVDKKYLSFSASGGSQQVHVNANSPWAIYSSPEWTEVRRLGGRLTIICTENTQQLEREEDVVLRIKSGQVIRIVVSQDKYADL